MASVNERHHTPKDSRPCTSSPSALSCNFCPCQRQATAQSVNSWTIYFLYRPWLSSKQILWAEKAPRPFCEKEGSIYKYAFLISGSF